jgi:periplasmic divalent cation tolerance protein
MADETATLVLVTAPPDAAAELARALVEERLAACVNRLDCRSTYRWDGAVHDDDEELLVVKTTTGRYDDLRARVAALHPYDLPAIERVDATPTDEAAAWVADAVGDG